MIPLTNDLINHKLIKSPSARSRLPFLEQYISLVEQGCGSCGGSAPKTKEEVADYNSLRNRLVSSTPEEKAILLEIFEGKVIRIYYRNAGGRAVHYDIRPT